MSTLHRVSLGFLGVVLQVIAVEAKRGGGGGSSSSGSKSKGKKGIISGGASIGGLSAGVLLGMSLSLAKPSPLTIRCSGLFLLLWLALYLLKYVGRTNNNQTCPNAVSKDHDFERNPVGGYPPQDPPGYVSRSTLFRFDSSSRTDPNDQPTSPPPVQYNQMDWKQEGGPAPPQFVPLRPVTPQFVPPRPASQYQYHPQPTTPQFHPPQPTTPRFHPSQPAPPQFHPSQPATPQFHPPQPATPQFHPTPPSFPPTPYMGAAYTPAQYSPVQTPPFPLPHSPPMQYPPMSPTPGHGGDR